MWVSVASRICLLNIAVFNKTQSSDSWWHLFMVLLTAPVINFIYKALQRYLNLLKSFYSLICYSDLYFVHLIRFFITKIQCIDVKWKIDCIYFSFYYGSSWLNSVLASFLQMHLITWQTRYVYNLMQVRHKMMNFKQRVRKSINI